MGLWRGRESVEVRLADVVILGAGIDGVADKLVLVEDPTGGYWGNASQGGPWIAEKCYIVSGL